MKSFYCTAYVSIVILTILFGCGSSKLSLNKSEVPDTLGINMTFRYDFPLPVRNSLLNGLNKFICRYNESNDRKFVLIRSRNGEDELNIHFIETQVVKPADHTAGMMVSMFGIMTPLILLSLESPVIVTFWYFPRTRSAMVIELSENLRTAGNYRLTKVYGSPGFLRSISKQLKLHENNLDRFLKRLIAKLSTG